MPRAIALRSDLSAPRLRVLARRRRIGAAPRSHQAGRRLSGEGRVPDGTTLLPPNVRS
jgi:hypothetical protein